VNEDELLAELEDRMDNPPLYWTPEGVPSGLDDDLCVTDEKIAGIVQSIEWRPDDYKGHYTVVIKRADQSRLQIQGYGTVLAGRFAELAVGDGLAIAFKGRVESKTAGYKPYLDYYVTRIGMGSAVPRVIADNGAESGATDPGEERSPDFVPHPADTA
jgi:hypothetical protein